MPPDLLWGHHAVQSNPQSWSSTAVTTMLPTISSFHLAQWLPDAQLSIHPDSGHGGIFLHLDVFVAQALDFLRA